MDNKTKLWHGIPRNEIDWSPSIDKEKCISCLSCVRFCKQGVYAENNGKSKIINPQNCVVGCRGCETICPAGAISHPSDEYLENLMKKGKSDKISDCCSSCKL